MNNCQIVVHNLVYSFDDRLLFHNVHFEIKKNSITCIVGSNNSGKTTLAKIIGGIYFTKDMVQVDHVTLNSHTIVAFKKKVSYISFRNFKFVSSSVYEELMYALEFTKWNTSKKEKMIQNVLTSFDLLMYKDRHPSRLSKKNKINLLLAKAVVFAPRVLVMELSDLLLNREEKDFIFETVSNFSKNITIIYETNNCEDILYADRMLVLHKGNVAIEGATEAVLKQDRLLLKLGVELPFMVDLSNKLAFYEVISDIYLKEEDLVNTLWK